MTTTDTAARRVDVLDAAARLLVEEGPHALSLRRVCAAVGGSTQLAYTLFGGKRGLADALYAEAFDRLARYMDDEGFEQPPPGDPERLLRIARAYRKWALGEPGFFAVVFGRPIPRFTPDPAVLAAGRVKTFDRAVAAAQGCLDAGTLAAADALTLASACWAATHGLSSLETNGVVGGGSDAIIGREHADAFAEHLIGLMIGAHRP